MKNRLILILFLLLTLFSCERREPYVYKYETNPMFSKGSVDFWGSFYSNYDIANNVLSLTAFTDSLMLNPQGYLYGFGQYLYLEDIFIAPSDTLLREGVYHVSDSGEPFTIAPGNAYKDKDDAIKDVGAYIYYFEPVESNSIRKFILDGTMKVTKYDQFTDCEFNFILDDKDSTNLKGSFHVKDLIYYDASNFAPVIGSRNKITNKRSK